MFAHICQHPKQPRAAYVIHLLAAAPDQPNRVRWAGAMAITNCAIDQDKDASAERKSYTTVLLTLLTASASSQTARPVT